MTKRPPVSLSLTRLRTPEMFHRFASTLFGDGGDELSGRGRPGEGTEEEEDDEDWILVNYLADGCSGHRGSGLSGSAVSPHEDEEEEDLVMVPSPMASPAVRYPSCTSLNSTADTDLDGGAEDDEDEEEEEEEEEGGFLRLDACSLEESWFVTPPCFTGHGGQPVLLETSPLENLLIEHPSMSVSRPPQPAAARPERDFLSGNASANQTAAGGKEKARPTLEGPRHRPEVAVVQRPLQPALHLLRPRRSPPTRTPAAAAGNATQRTQLLSRKALRRLNLLRPAKAATLHLHLHQPSQRHLNF